MIICVNYLQCTKPLRKNITEIEIIADECITDKKRIKNGIAQTE